MGNRKSYIKNDKRLIGNKFAFGNAGNKASFKKGHIPSNFKGLEKPRVLNHKRDGLQVVTTIEDKKPAKSRGKNYLTKKRTNYARVVFGLDKIPEGYVIYHIDQNSLNNDISNLKLITRSELIKLNLQNRRIKTK